MPLNGSGSYSAPASTWNPAVTNTTINSTDWTALLADLTTAISTAMYKDGQATPTANIPMGGFKLTGLAAGNASGNSVRYEQVPLLATLTTKGDLYVATASATTARLPVGSNGSIPMARSADTNGVAYVAALNKYIYGLTYDVGTDTTNDININTGAAMDATGAYWMTLGTALGKQSDVAWAVGGTTGSPAGWLDTGAVGNNDYYIWLIARSDTGVVDSLCSLSSTAPTMPAAGAYDFKRLIGWFKRVGGTVVAFHTYETEGGGLEMNWDSPTTDVNLVNTLTTARRTDAVKVPLNFSTISHLVVVCYDASSPVQLWIYCPDQSDLAASGTLENGNSVTTKEEASQKFIRTSATGTVASRASLATVDTYTIVTVGFRWARRN